MRSSSWSIGPLDLERSRSRPERRQELRYPERKALIAEASEALGTLS
jgi:hypothetical protein